MPVTKDDGTVVLALVRGDDRLEEAKLARGARRGRAAVDRGGDPRRVRRRPRLARPGRLQGRGVADETLREGQFVAGANRTGWHLRGVEHGRDFEARFADLREPIEGDRCPTCGGALRFQTAIEVGHIFKLGTRYSVPLGATFLDEDGDGEAARDGQLRHRPRRGSWPPRSSSATTSNGIFWPPAIAPYDVHVVALPGAEEQGGEAARVALRRRAATCCSTTATCAPGEKFADADLIGLPIRVTVGKKTLEDGTVDVRDRRHRRGRRV